jgi:hypothetical protein
LTEYKKVLEMAKGGVTMNISQLMRSVMGDLQVSDTKSLELKVGQVVRGIVLKMLSDQDALVNIGGVQVRAHLEAPLQQGQATLLQVQPESVTGQVVLKPLEASGVQIAERSLPELLKGFDLKDTASNRRALHELHQAQVPLTKENVKAYAGITARIPEGVDEGQWREAAMLAVKRGLPVSQESVGSLHRALFGKPVDQSLQNMGELLARAMSAEGGEEVLSPATRALMGQVRQAVEALAAMPKQLAAEAPPQQAQAAGQGQQAAAGGDSGASAARGGAAGEAAARQAQAGTAAQQTSGSAAAAGGKAADAGVGAAGGQAQPQRGEAAGAAGGTGAAGARSAEGAAPQAQGGAGAAPADAQEPAPWVGRLLKALGVQHEQQLAPRPQDRGGSDLPPHARAAGDNAPPAPNPAAPQGADAEPAKTVDTLKSLLLQLSTADDAPPAVRESAQQLVQQVTGQQLLLTPDRASMFTHMTLMLPLINQNGSQTAAIHIQSRRGSKGELDSTNCHLVFDLNMKTLGNTLVDVQVIDRIVALRVHNDFPEIGELLEEHREDIKAGLEKIGYQFLSLKVMPYPEPVALSAGNADGAAGADAASAASRAANLYHSKPYKGVDFRV